MIRTDNDAVKPLTTVFYKRYVDDIYSHRKEICTDRLHHELNNYHLNMNLIIENNPKKFLDNQFITKNGKQKTAFYRKSAKLPLHWSWNKPKWYKRNATNADQNRSKWISRNFDTKICELRRSF